MQIIISLLIVAFISLSSTLQPTFFSISECLNVNLYRFLIYYVIYSKVLIYYVIYSIFLSL